MDLAKTTEATTVPATRTTYVGTVAANRLSELAAKEAFREICGFVTSDMIASACMNPDGSMTVTVVIVTVDRNE